MAALSMRPKRASWTASGLAFVAVLAALACGGSTSGSGSNGVTDGGGTTLLAADFDRTCTFDGECTLVSQGDQCSCSSTCNNASIAQSALSRWTAARDAIVCTNPPIPCPLLCMNSIAVCANGSCGIRTPLNIDETSYDRSCASDSDCHLIYTGEVCSACKCSAGAVNTAGYEQYQKEIAGVTCNPGPSVCDCAFIGTVSCVKTTAGGAGVCTVG